MSFNPVVVWFLAGLALILAEFALPGVILVFFGLGAWLAAVTTWLHLTPGWTSQLLTFAFSSVILLVLLRRRFRTRLFGHEMDPQDPAANLDAITGEPVTVSVAIAPGRDDGRVEYKGAAWNARSDVELTVGSRAEVVAVDGITLIVRPRA